MAQLLTVLPELTPVPGLEVPANLRDLTPKAERDRYAEWVRRYRSTQDRARAAAHTMALP